jgi:hypothetical protein
LVNTTLTGPDARPVLFPLSTTRVHILICQTSSHRQRTSSLNLIIQTCRGSSIGRACGSYHLMIFPTSRSRVRAPPSAIPTKQVDISFCRLLTRWWVGRVFFFLVSGAFVLADRVALNSRSTNPSISRSSSVPFNSNG